MATFRLIFKTFGLRHPMVGLLLIGIGMISYAERMIQDQQKVDLHALISELGQPQSTDWAARKAKLVGMQDASARQALIPPICQLLKRSESDEVWRNAVRLAGSLRITEAVPLLGQAFSRGRIGSLNTGFNDQFTLDNDLVARALADIGNPAIAIASNFLKTGGPRDRVRAIEILRKINSHEARDVLRDHLPEEKDAHLRALIENYLKQTATQ